MNAKQDRRLVVTVSGRWFRIETEYRNRLGYWNLLSTTVTETWPWLIIRRIADRDDYGILVRVQKTR